MGDEMDAVIPEREMKVRKLARASHPSPILVLPWRLPDPEARVSAAPPPD